VAELGLKNHQNSFMLQGFTVEYAAFPGCNLSRACGNSRDKGMNLLSVVETDRLILTMKFLGNIT